MFGPRPGSGFTSLPRDSACSPRRTRCTRRVRRGLSDLLSLRRRRRLRLRFRLERERSRKGGSSEESWARNGLGAMRWSRDRAIYKQAGASRLLATWATHGLAGRTWRG